MHGLKLCKYLYLLSFPPISFSILRNPVTNKKHYRLYVIYKVPQVRVLDFQKVKLKVSTLALANFSSEKSDIKHLFCLMGTFMSIPNCNGT